MTKATPEPGTTRTIGDKIAIVGILAMVAANQMGTGILNAVIPVKLAADGHPASAAGFVTTVFSITFLIGCLVGPSIVRRLGPTTTLIAIGLLNAALALMHWASSGPLVWAAIRGVAGLSTATYFILIETWLSSVAGAGGRGMVFGAYMVAIRTAFAVGQFAIAFVAPDNVIHLLLLAAIVYALAPWFRPKADPTVMPPMAAPSIAAMLALPKRAPASAAVAVCHGLVFGAVPGLLPKWGLDAGIGVASVGAALAAIQVGGLLLQMPASYASDRIERRTVMASMTAITALVSLAVLWTGVTGGALWIVLMLLWGGSASALYSLAAAHAGDLAPPEERVAWTSSLMFIWGCGAAIGPIIAAVLMDVSGSGRLWSYAAIVSAVVGAFLIWRKIIRP